MSIYAAPIKVTEVPNTKDKRLIKGLTCGVQVAKQDVRTEIVREKK